MYEIKESNIHGFGVFATQDLKSDTNIGTSHIGIGFLNDKVIAGETTDIGRCQNHSNNCNSEYKIIGKDLNLVLTEDVSKGTEILVNYHNNVNVCINIENSESWNKLDTL
tara:strand:+ start:127 stop:456 length:330 start_codon:yes stop_codon:yes gene_type:complete